jgi:adenosylhomocysteine nucleosidase
MSKIAIIAAMEREVKPLIRGWKLRTLEHGGHQYRLFENGDAVLICGGIGAEAARRATEVVIQEARPMRVVSVGFAGALDSTLKVADIFEPRTVINAPDGARAETGSGQGTLVSCAAVAGREQKQRLGRAYGAAAVDMEAAAVAQGAQVRGVEFAALKAISDVADFSMPATERFVASDGQFRTVKFALHIAVRPWLWGSTIVLARNSARASRALCTAIEAYLRRETFASGTSRDQSPRERDMEQARPSEAWTGHPHHPLEKH